MAVELASITYNCISHVILIAVLFFVVHRIEGTDTKGLLESIKSGLVQTINAINDTKASDKSSEREYKGVDLEIQAEAAIAVDADSGKILFSKNKNEKMFPASLTKLMTALILAEEMDKRDVLTYSRRAKEQEANKLDFPEGSTMTAENAMQAMLVFSANDIAYMIAENMSGSSDKFTKLME